MTEIPRVFNFQTSVETLRAHHWRSFVDAYSGCAFNCQYCLYKGPDDYGRHVKATVGTTTADSSLGILDIGTSTDPYQPIEDSLQKTRSILEAALERKIPIFLLTRGTLVSRDVDILQDLAREGLVEACFSVITLNERLAGQLEVRAPTPRERLEAASLLVDKSIPVSFHVAPVIPGMNSPEHMKQLGRELGVISGRHVFSAMLGAQKAFWNSFYDVMEAASADCHAFGRFADAYGRDLDFDRASAVTCDFGAALPELEPLREGVIEADAIFVSENYPHLTTGALEGGIYRWKLPTVYDMADWVSEQGQVVGWTDFRGWFQTFSPGDRLEELTKRLWDSGELFIGTTLVCSDGEPTTYQAGDGAVSETARRTLVARRSR